MPTITEFNAYCDAIIERAEADYGVIIDPVTLKVDLEKTQELREQRKRGG